MTLTQAFCAYAADVIAFCNQSASTEEQHYLVLRSLINFMGDITVDKLDFPLVRDWKISLDKRNLSVLTVRLYLTRLRAVLSYLKREGVRSLDPQVIKLPKRSQSVPSVLSAEEVQLLINSTSKLRNKAIISLLYSAGLRVSELTALNRSDVAQDHFNLVGKGGKDRLCFIDTRTRNLLNEYLECRTQGYDVYVKCRGKWTSKVRYHVKGDSSPALFITPQTGERITASTVQEIVRRASKSAGFDWPVHPHTLRHSFATNLTLNGIDLYQLMKLMGHSSLQTTQIYLHIHNKHLEEDYAKYHSV